MQIINNSNSNKNLTQLYICFQGKIFAKLFLIQVVIKLREGSSILLSLRRDMYEDG